MSGKQKNPRKRTSGRKIDEIKKRQELEMPLNVGGKERAVPGSLKCEDVDVKKGGGVEVEVEIPEIESAPTDAERVSKWVADRMTGKDGVDEADGEEVFTLTKSDLIDLLDNPLGALVGANEKDADFVHAYMRLGNVEDALREVNYAPKNILMNKTAMVALASRMMSRPEIRSAISWVRSQRVNDLIVSRDEYADILSQQIRGNISDMLDDDGQLVPSKIKKHGRCIKSYSSAVTKSGHLKVSITMRSPIEAGQELQKFEEWENQSRNNDGGGLGNDALETLKKSGEYIDVEVQEANVAETDNSTEESPDGTETESK